MSILDIQMSRRTGRYPGWIVGEFERVVMGPDFVLIAE